MPGILYRGLAMRVEGLDVANPGDKPELALRMKPPADGARRRGRVRMVILHTTKGQARKKLRAGTRDDVDNASRVARYWSRSDKQSGAHLIVDHDRDVSCLADIASIAAYHAGSVNHNSVGIELYEGRTPDGYGVLWEGQLDAMVRLVDWITVRFGIQRQIHWPYIGPIDRLEDGGRDCYGVFGHRDQTGQRGTGDPGDLVMDRLRIAGYESFDFDRGDDRSAWSTRQEWLNRRHSAGLSVDGIPGPATTAALRAAGYPHGLWALGEGNTCDVADVRLDELVQDMIDEWGAPALVDSMARLGVMP